MPDYPVFTRKLHTDVSYLAGMRFLLSDPAAFYPQFATHNAHSVASAYVAGGNNTYEFQRLHGMGEALYEEVVGADKLAKPCRIYAPVGGHEDLLAYLVRRLLENGANTSFVNRLADEKTAVLPRSSATRSRRPSIERAEGIAGKAAAATRSTSLPTIHTASASTAAVSGSRTQPCDRSHSPRLPSCCSRRLRSARLSPASATTGGDAAQLVHCPHDRRERVGTVVTATPEHIEAALAAAAKAAHGWDRLGGPARGAILERAADLYERDRLRLMAVIIREAGKTLDNALGDVREAVDFLRYYALEARRLFSGPVSLRGPTGETNELSTTGTRADRCDRALEFPARDLHRASGSSAGCWKSRPREARRANADHSVPGDRAAA